MTSLDELTSAQAAQRAAAGSVLVVPVGSTEQHGAHLPLGTDLFIARELVARVSARVPSVIRAPELGFGSSGEHQSFAGTVSVGRDVVHDALLELGRSASITFDRILLVTTHGGNAEPVTAAVRRLRYEGRDVRAWAPDWTSLLGRIGRADRIPDAHAGWLETSLMLAIAPRLVHLRLARPGATSPIAELLPALRAGGVAAVSASGVLGDPGGADAVVGARLLAAASESVADLLATWPARRADSAPGPGPGPRAQPSPSVPS